MFFPFAFGFIGGILIGMVFSDLMHEKAGLKDRYEDVHRLHQSGLPGGPTPVANPLRSNWLSIPLICAFGLLCRRLLYILSTRMDMEYHSPLREGLTKKEYTYDRVAGNLFGRQVQGDQMETFVWINIAMIVFTDDGQSMVTTDPSGI